MSCEGSSKSLGVSSAIQKASLHVVNLMLCLWVSPAGLQADSFPSLMLHCSVSLAVAVLGFVIVHNSIQNHMSITNTFKFAYSFIRLPKLSARNFAEGLATLLLAPVFLGDFFRTQIRSRRLRARLPAWQSSQTTAQYPL